MLQGVTFLHNFWEVKSGSNLQFHHMVDACVGDVHVRSWGWILAGWGVWYRRLGCFLAMDTGTCMVLVTYLMWTRKCILPLSQKRSLYYIVGRACGVVYALLLFLYLGCVSVACISPLGLLRGFETDGMLSCFPNYMPNIWLF